MEKDSFIYHGISEFLFSKFMDDADKFPGTVCDKCGLFIAATDERPECKGCNNKKDFSEVMIPYTCKLLFQELIAMCIVPRLIVKK